MKVKILLLAFVLSFLTAHASSDVKGNGARIDYKKNEKTIPTRSPISDELDIDVESVSNFTLT